MDMKLTKTHGKLTVAALAGVGVGAIAMFLFDPVAGRRRRALLRNKTAAAANDAADAASSTARDLQNHAKALAHYAAGATANVIRWSGPERRSPPRRTAAERQAGIGNVG